MAIRTVVWSDIAFQQRRCVFKYWNKRNGSTKYSEKLLKHIRFRTNQLIDHPLSGKQTEIDGIRITSLGHFSILYKLTADRIIVVGFWDTRQDPEKLLKSLY